MSSAREWAAVRTIRLTIKALKQNNSHLHFVTIIHNHTSRSGPLLTQDMPVRWDARKPGDPAQASSRHCGAVYDEAVRKPMNVCRWRRVGKTFSL